MRLTRALLQVLIGMSFAGVGPCHAQGRTPPEAFQAVYEKHCSFVEERRWSDHRDVVSNLEEQDNDILLDMAIAGDASMQLCSWMLLAAARDQRIVPIASEYIADTNNDPEDRDFFCDLIKGFAGMEVLPAMLSVLSEPLDHGANSRVKICAVQTLGGVDHDEAIDRLRELLEDPSYKGWWGRWSIIQSLGRLRDTTVVPQLIAIARDPDGNAREKQAATQALATIGTPESIAPLIELVESFPAGSRHSVGWAVENNLRAVRDRTDDPVFRLELENLLSAVQALTVEFRITYDKYCTFMEDEGLLGEVAATVDDDVRDVLGQMAVAEDTEMRRCAWTLLGAVGDIRVVSSISEFIADPSNDPEKRVLFCDLIKGFGGVEALPAMLSALSEPLDHDTNSRLHSCAIWALGNIDQVEARERLRELLEDPAYDWARGRIVMSLGRLRDTAAVPQLIALVRAQEVSDHFVARYAATEALAAIGTCESIVPLLEVLEDMPAGPDHRNVGKNVARRLEEARDRTEDPVLRAELERLISAIRSMMMERLNS